jgi:hypothetical protein
MDNLQKLNIDNKKLRIEEDFIISELNQLSSLKEDTEEKLVSIQSLYKLLSSTPDQERIDIRIKLRSKLRMLGAVSKKICPFVDVYDDMHS